MGDTVFNFFDNIIFIRKYRNRYHIWFQRDEQTWLTFFKMRYDEEFHDFKTTHNPKKLITWEE